MYEVGASLFATRDQAVQALAELYVSANGLNGPEEKREATQAPEECADELLAQWGGLLTHQTEPEDGAEWATREELARAIAHIDPDD